MARYYSHELKARKSKSPWLRSVGVLFVAMLILGSIYVNRDAWPNAGPKQPTTTPHPTAAYTNSVEKRAMNDLQQFQDWLTDNQAEGYIGEFGWQQNTDADQWKHIAKSWLDQLRSTDLWATAWAAGSYWGDYPLAIYGSTDASKGLDTSKPQAGVLAPYIAKQGNARLGVNIAGMEFGTSTLTNTKPGVAGQDYFYEPTASFAYLRAQGIDLVRLPVRWERVQPQLNGPLNQKEVSSINTILAAAHSQNIDVILDLHNYGAYKTDNGEVKLGSSILGAAQLEDVWLKLSREFRDKPAVIGYSIMNEPHDIVANNTQDATERWEGISQRVVNGLRSAGDTNTFMIPGYDWSSLSRWTKNHPKAWIKDPLHNFRYEAHHYWDSDGSGTYTKPFSEEQSLAP